MKLRNKKTGETIDAFFGNEGVRMPLQVWAWHVPMNTQMGEYYSLSALFEEWEDVKDGHEEHEEDTEESA